MNRTLQLHEKILLAVLVLVVVGAGYYFYSLSQQRAEQDAQTGSQYKSCGPNSECPVGYGCITLDPNPGGYGGGRVCIPDSE